MKKIKLSKAEKYIKKVYVLISYNRLIFQKGIVPNTIVLLGWKLSKDAKIFLKSKKMDSFLKIKFISMNEIIQIAKKQFQFLENLYIKIYNKGEPLIDPKEFNEKFKNNEIEAYICLKNKSNKRLKKGCVLIINLEEFDSEKVIPLWMSEESALSYLERYKMLDEWKYIKINVNNLKKYIEDTFGDKKHEIIIYTFG